MNGVIVIDKPQGFTSFDVVAVMRRACGQKKIGHTGTLDPMATGVLPLLLGCATRAEPLLDDSGKEYEASFRLGFSTDTEDTTGRVTAQSGVRVTREEILNRIPEFTGEILQTPPMYSAVHKDGKRLYELARQGVEVEREKRPVTITRLELLAFDEERQEGRLAVACSKGTYIRTLCADLALSCGSLGVMSALRRTRAAGFGLDDAVPLEQARRIGAAGAPCGRAVPGAAAGERERGAGGPVRKRRRVEPAKDKRPKGDHRRRGASRLRAGWEVSRSGTCGSCRRGTPGAAAVSAGLESV